MLAGELLTRLAAPKDAAAGLVLAEKDLWLRDAKPIRARLYLPEGGHGHGIVVSHGVHFRGIDEPRLVSFARALARSGLVVLTPELDDLIDYRVSQRGIDVIGQSIRYLGARRDLVTEQKVGVIGFSFAGGLSLVAAAKPELADRIAFVTSVGGHHDLARVLEFLLSGVVATPTGPEHREPHEYGLVILTYEHLDHFVPGPDRAVMGDALRAWLQEDRPRARTLASLRTTAEGEHVFMLLETHQLGTLASELRHVIAEHGAELDALSPKDRLAHIRAPVYLLHGSADSVIPPSEAEWAARELEVAHTPHLALVTPLIEHVEVDKTAGLEDKIELVHFMAQLM